MATNASDINGRVSYIDPTNVAFLRRDSVNDITIVPSNELVFNSLEDYCIAVDLEVMVPNRNACGWAMEDGAYKVLKYSSANGTISFLGGTNGLLTTRFTEINPLMPGEGISECLGIESINISFESWMTPNVDIKFVDVRGASVMAPEEKHFFDGDDGGTMGSLYRALFAYPPPLFKLRVKGFYGKGVTYYLSLFDVKMDLDSSSGNFNILVKLIGSMYRIYTDLPMTYIATAPYLENGKRRWEEMVQAGVFAFRNRDNTTSPMIPFPELLEKVAKAASSSTRTSAAAKRESITESTDKRVESIRSIIKNCPIKTWAVYNDTIYVGDVPGKEQDISTQITNYIASIRSYDEAYKTSYASVFEALEKYSEKDKGYKKIHKVSYTKEPSGFTYDKKNSTMTEDEAGFVADSEPNKFKSGKLEGFNGNLYTFYIMPSVSSDGINTFLKNIEQEAKNAEEEKEREVKEYERLEQQYIEEALGFSPTIKNIYNLIFAHMDTFLNAFYGNTKEILNQINSQSDDREISRVLGGGMSTDCTQDTKFLPPYTEFFEKLNENGQTRNASVWLEKFPGGENLEEVKLVNDILSAAKMYCDEVAARLPVSGASGGGMAEFLTNAPSTNVKQFLPLTLYDMVNKDTMRNPYSWITTAREMSEDEMMDSIFGTFVNRAYYYLYTTGGDKADDFGKLDAINFAKAIGNDYTQSKYWEVLKKIKNGSSVDDNIYDRVRKVGESNIWNFGEKRIIDDNGKSVIKEGFLPIGFGNITEIGRANASGDNRFICANKENEILFNKKTFNVIESRDYVQALCDNIKSEVSANYEKVGANVENVFASCGTDLKTDNDDLLFMKGIVYTLPNSRDEEKAVNNRKTDGLADLANKSYADRKGHYVKYPTAINEDEKRSVFDYPIYKVQSSMYSKAYLFLSSVPLKNWSEHQKCGVSKRSENGIEQKIRLLREGSFYWREKEINNGHEPIICEATIDGKTFKCNTPGPKETFFGYRVSEANVETLNVEHDGKYVDWAEPNGSSPSRKTVLIDMFEKWAKNEYQNVESMLADKKFYNDNDYGKGLNSDLLRISDADATARSAERIQEFLLGLFLDVDSIIEYHGGSSAGEAKNVKNAINGFINGLRKIYEEDLEKNDTQINEMAASVRVEDPFKNNDLKLSTYQTLKNLYDRWLCAPYKGQGTWQMDNPNSDFDQFLYLDSFYHQIGDSFLINITKFANLISACLPAQSPENGQSISTFTNMSVYEVLAEIAQDSGGMLIAFPQMIGGQSAENVADMFVAYPYNSHWVTDSSCFCFLYTYEPSRYLENPDFANDGIDFTAEQYDFLNDDGLVIPAFGVSYGKQNQAYFKNLTLNTETPNITNYSIASTMHIASKAGDGERETEMFGQDMYKVRATYAYTCEFDMMGCMMVFPMMYFQLNNVPLWRGAYIIYKVTHQITAGDMTTHVVGVRINKNALPMVEGAIPPQKNAGVEGENGGGEGGTYSTASAAGASASEGTNNTGNPQAKIPDTVDITESNITEQKPVICITPAHGPNTQKKLEHAWSSKLIDEYIIPKLKRLKFFDGTSYAMNIQRCNKGGNHTGKGYSMQETKSFINKYGSKKVISMVPHWNGAGGTYYCVFDGKRYSDGSVKYRKDSAVFAEMLREEVRKMAVKGNNGEYSMPPGAMKVGVMSVKEGQDKGHILSADNTDGAPQLDCACILSENWFADYEGGSVMGKGHKWSRDGWDAKDGNGKFITMRGWIESPEGLNALADAHVEAIRRYIDSLHQ